MCVVALFIGESFDFFIIVWRENDGVVGLVNYRGGGRGIRQQHMHMCMVPTNYYLILPSEQRLYVQPKFQPSTDTRPCPIIIIN